MPAVDDYIRKQKSPQKEILQKVRKLILKTLPGATEEMRWGVPVYDDGRYYIVGLKDHVNLGFSVNGLAGSEMKLLDGHGKTMGHIKIDSLSGIDEKRIVNLLKLVKKKAKCECRG